MTGVPWTHDHMQQEFDWLIWITRHQVYCSSSSCDVFFYNMYTCTVVYLLYTLFVGKITLLLFEISRLFWDRIIQCILRIISLKMGVFSKQSYMRVETLYSSPKPKANRWVYIILMLRATIRRPQFSNIFSETAWPIIDIFYVESPWIGKTKVCSQQLSHMTKMAATSICGETLQFFFLPNWRKLARIIGGSCPS